MNKNTLTWIRALEDDEGLDTEVERGQASSEEVLAQLASIPGCPDELLELYRKHDGLTVRASGPDWTTSVGFLPARLILSNWVAELNDEHHDIRFFESFEPDGTETRAVGWRPDGTLVLFHEDLFDLNIELDEYLELMSLAQGHMYWRHAWASGQGYPEHTTAPALFREQFSRRFGDEASTAMLARFGLARAASVSTQRHKVALFDSMSLRGSAIDVEGVDLEALANYTFFVCSIDADFFRELDSEIPERSLPHDVVSQGLDLAHRVTAHLLNQPGFVDQLGSPRLSDGFHTASLEEVTAWVSSSSFDCFDPSEFF